MDFEDVERTLHSCFVKAHDTEADRVRKRERRRQAERELSDLLRDQEPTAEQAYTLAKILSYAGPGDSSPLEKPDFSSSPPGSNFREHFFSEVTFPAWLQRTREHGHPTMPNPLQRIRSHRPSPDADASRSSFRGDGPPSRTPTRCRWRTRRCRPRPGEPTPRRPANTWPGWPWPRLTATPSAPSRAGTGPYATTAAISRPCSSAGRPQGGHGGGLRAPAAAQPRAARSPRARRS